MIDTVQVHTTDFEIGEHPRLTQKQGVIDRSTGEVKNHFFLYRDRSGKDVYGGSEFSNTSLYNLTIDSRGLFLKFTPARVFFGCNYFSINNNQLKHITQEIQTTLQDSDIYLNMDDTTLSRIDLAKNIHTDKPFTAYSPLFSFLQGQRMKTYEFPSGYRYGNQSRQVVFYDKLEELQTVQKVDLKRIGIPPQDTLRGELRFFSSKVIKRDLPHKKLGQLYLKSNYEDMKDSYKHYLKKLVFRSGSDQKIKFHFTREVEFLQELRKRSKRGAIAEYFAVTGLEQVLQMFGSLDHFKAVLIEVGFDRTYVWRQINQLNDRLKLRSQIEKKYENDTISTLFQEINTKFLN